MTDSNQNNPVTTTQGITGLHAVLDDHATIGTNPYREQSNRWKKTAAQIELAQEELSRMGSVYESGGHKDLSEYCQALFLALEGVLLGIRSLRQHM